MLFAEHPTAVVQQGSQFRLRTGHVAAFPKRAAKVQPDAEDRRVVTA
ncbi:hypothetical protein ACFSTC_56840 [Nonomuraea ferruginea]